MVVGEDVLPTVGIGEAGCGRSQQGDNLTLQRERGTSNCLIANTVKTKNPVVDCFYGHVVTCSPEQGVPGPTGGLLSIFHPHFRISISPALGQLGFYEYLVPWTLVGASSPSPQSTPSPRGTPDTKGQIRERRPL